MGVLAEEILIDADAPFEALHEWFVRYRFRTKVDIELLDEPCHAVFSDEVPDGVVRGRYFGPLTREQVETQLKVILTP